MLYQYQCYININVISISMLYQYQSKISKSLLIDKQLINLCSNEYL